MLLTLTHISAAAFGAFIVLGIQALRDASRERAKRELAFQIRNPVEVLARDLEFVERKK